MCNGKIDVAWDFQVPWIERDVHNIGHNRQPDVEFAGIANVRVPKVDCEGSWLWFWVP